MKEKKITDKKILSELEKKGFIIIEPICINCISDVVCLVLTNFSLATFQVENLDDFEKFDNCLFRLKVML